MIIGNIDTDKQVFIIAEAGNNHEGDFDTALKLIDAAANSGANAIKFQAMIPEKLVPASETKRREQLKRFQLSMEQYTKLANHAKEKGIYFMCTPFARETIDDLSRLVPAFKISSGDLTWHHLIKDAASTGLPVILSTGGATPDEIDLALNAYEEGKGHHPNQVAILHCVMAYPAEADTLNLNILKDFQKKYSTIGYSDHFLGINSCIAAVALGARIIEKHFTLDKNSSEFRDHQLSATPEEMSTLVKSIREIEPMLGHSEKKIQECEKAILPIARRSPKAKHALKSNHTITPDDIEILRPNSGLDAHEQVIGKTTLVAIEQGEDINI